MKPVSNATIIKFTGLEEREGVGDASAGTYFLFVSTTNSAWDTKTELGSSHLQHQQ